MNVYDFDRTLFPGDSSMHFWAYCKKRYPLIWLHFPAGITKMALYKLGIFHWAQVMEKFFSFMKYLPDKEKIIEEFWDERWLRAKKEKIIESIYEVFYLCFLLKFQIVKMKMIILRWK